MVKTYYYNNAVAVGIYELRQIFTHLLIERHLRVVRIGVIGRVYQRRWKTAEIVHRRLDVTFVTVQPVDRGNRSLRMIIICIRRTAPAFYSRHYSRAWTVGTAAVELRSISV